MQHKEASDEELIDEMARLSGFTERRQEGARTGVTKVYTGDHELRRAYELLGLGKPEMAMIHMESVIETWMPWLNSFSRADLLTNDPPKLLTYLPLLREIAQRGVRYRDQTLQENQERFGRSWMFSAEELADPKAFYPYLMMDIEDALSKRLFKLYQYKAGGDSLNPEVPYRIYPTVGISHSLEAWFGFLDRQSNWLAQREEVIVSLFIKLDPVSTHYASFVISIHYKGTIWMATDQLKFYNPQNRATSRNPQRNKESHYEHIGLPYEWVEQLPQLKQEFGGILRNNATEQIVRSAAEIKARVGEVDQNREDTLLEIGRQTLGEKNLPFTHARLTYPERLINTSRAEYVFQRDGMTVGRAVYDDDSIVVSLIYFPDILPVPVTRMSVGERLYLMMLAERLLEEIMYQPPSHRLMLATRYLDQKLLEGANFDPMANTATGENEGEFTGWKKVHQHRASEIIESVNGESTALVPKNYGMVRQASQYDANWLATPEALDTLMKWTVLNDEAKVIKENLKTLQERCDEDTATLKVMLTGQLDRLVTLALTEPPEMIIEEAYGHQTFTDKPEPTSVNWIMWTPESKLHTRPGQQPLHSGRYSWTAFAIGYHQPRVRYGTTPKAVCGVCNVHKLDTKPKLIFDVKHYRQLMLLLGITDRMQLPAYFRNYMSHQFLPYKGNSILNNVHPYALLNDPCSEKHPNGMTVQVFLCKTCLNRIAQRVEETPSQPH